MQLQNRINYLEKIKTNIDSINEFIKRICKKQSINIKNTAKD